MKHRSLFRRTTPCAISSNCGSDSSETSHAGDDELCADLTRIWAFAIAQLIPSRPVITTFAITVDLKRYGATVCIKLSPFFLDHQLHRLLQQTLQTRSTILRLVKLKSQLCESFEALRNWPVMESYLLCFFLGFLDGCEPSTGSYTKSNLHIFSKPRLKLMYFVVDSPSTAQVQDQPRFLQECTRLPFSTPQL